MAQYLRFIGELQPRQLIGILADIAQCIGHNLQVIVGIDPARYGESGQLQRGFQLLARILITAQQERTYLHAAHTGFQIEGIGQRLTRELMIGDPGQHAAGIDENGMAACR